MSDAFAKVRDRIVKKSGLDVAHTVDARTVERLVAREAKAAGIDVDTFIDRATSANGPQWRALIDAVANGHTWFFREQAALDAAVAHLRTCHAPTLWSAACSTGQEPWSVALACTAAGVSVDIVGTDVNDGALDVARAASWDDRARRGVPPWAEGFFAGDALRTTSLTARVRFEAGSLVDDPPGSFDVVICRNVLFYLSDDAVVRALDRLRSALKPNGILILGAAEARYGLAAKFATRDVVGRLCFVRDDVPSPTKIASLAPIAMTASSAAIADPVAFLERGHDAFAQRRFDDAAAAYDDAIGADPLWWEGHAFRGLCARKRGRFDDATVALERALFLEPRAWPAALLLAGCYRRSGRDVDAAREERRARRLLDEGAIVPLASPAGAKLLPSVEEALSVLAID